MKSWLWQYNAFHVTYVMPVSDRRQYSLLPGFSDAQIGVSINQKGFRAPVFEKETDSQAPVLVVLGDSKAFGAGVSDAETYSFQISRIFNKNNSSFRVVNAGISSYNTRQVIDRFRIDVLPQYKPTVVTLQGALNDVTLLSYYRENWNPNRTWADVRYAGFRPPLPVFQKIAMFYYLNKALTQNSSESVNRLGNNITYQSFPDQTMLGNLREELKDFLTLCRENSIAVILMPIDPFYYQTANFEKNQNLPLWKQNSRYVEMWKDMLTHHDDLLIELSSENEGVYFFDTRKFLDNTDRSDLYVDFIHYSPKGNRLIAEGLYNFMNDKGLLGEKTGSPNPQAGQ